MTPSKGKQLHPWLFTGGCLLVANAGFVNTVAFLGFENKAVSYMTGNVANAGMQLGHGAPGAALEALLLVGLFVLGATFNGLVIGSSNFSLDERYGLVLGVQTALLVGALLWMDRGGESVVTGEYVVAAVCGMQNSMTTIYSGAVVRTTHLTGALTDLGSAIGHWLRGDRSGVWRIGFYSAAAASFVGGGALGVVGFARLGSDALWASALFYALLSAIVALGARPPAPREADA